MEYQTQIALAGNLIALSAMFVALWNVKSQRKHARLSVTPHIDFYYGITTKDPLGLYLINNGIGPAKITDFSVIIKGDRVQPDRIMGLWDAVFKKLGAEAPSEANDILSGQMLRAGDEILLFRFDSSNESDVNNLMEEIGSFESVLKQFEIKVSYESLYDVRYNSSWKYPFA